MPGDVSGASRGVSIFPLAPRAGCKASRASFTLHCYKRSTQCSVEGAGFLRLDSFDLGDFWRRGRRERAESFLLYFSFFFPLRVELEHSPVGQALA